MTSDAKARRLGPLAQLFAAATLLVVLTFARAASARVGLAEWSIETSSGAIVCHCDNGPTAGAGVVVYLPGRQTEFVGDVDAFKIYPNAVVGSTSSGDFFLFDGETRAFHRFARHEELDAAIAKGGFLERGGFFKLVMVWAGYALAALALAYGLFALFFRNDREKRPIERRIGLYVTASFFTVIFGATAFVVLPYLDWSLLRLDAPEWNGGVLLFGVIMMGIPSLFAVGLLVVLADLLTIGATKLLARHLPSRWAWLLLWAFIHVLALRGTIGEYILRQNPYWRSDY